MTDSATYTQRQITSWRNALFVVFALGGIGMASWAARIPEVSNRLSLDSSQVGILLFGLAAGSILGLTASSHIVASFGVRRTIAVALIISPIGLALAGVGAGVLQSFALAFVGLAIYGAAIGVCDVAMNVSGAANETALRRTIMPIYHAFWSFGTMAGAATGVLAEVFRMPLEIHLALVSLLVVVTSLVVVRYILGEPHHEPGLDRAASDAQHERTTWRARLAIWREPRTLTIGLIVLGMAFAEGSANDWLSYAMVEGHDTDQPTGAVVLGVFLTAMTVGRLGGVKLLDKFGRVPVLRVSALFATVGLLMLIMVPVVWIAIVGTVLWGLGASLGFPVGMSAAADDPRKAAARVSAVATIGYVAFLVGPPAIGFLGDQVGILNGLLLVLVLVAIAGIASPAARERNLVTAPTL